MKIKVLNGHNPFDLKEKYFKPKFVNAVVERHRVPFNKDVRNYLRIYNILTDVIEERRSYKLWTFYEEPIKALHDRVAEIIKKES